MPLTTLPAPCWTFACQQEDAGSARWREHALNPAELLFIHMNGCCRPYQLDSHCVEAVCDHCRIPYLGRHFATQAQAAEQLHRAGWTNDAHGCWHCDTCPILYRLTSAATEALSHGPRRTCRPRRLSSAPSREAIETPREAL